MILVPIPKTPNYRWNTCHAANTNIKLYTFNICDPGKVSEREGL